MGVNSIPVKGSYRRAALLLSVAMALVITFVAVQAMSASEVELTAADLSGSSKSVNRAEATAGSTLEYTIIISNSGGSTTNVSVTDTLPSGLVFQSLEPPTGNAFIPEGEGEKNGVITMTGILGGNSFATFQFTAILTGSLSEGQVITNTALITGAGSLVTKSASTTVIAVEPGTTLYLPIVFTPLSVPTIESTRPNSSNSWVVSWDTVDAGITGYELQESQTPDFSNALTWKLSAKSRAFTHNASFNNVYYYRVRATDGQMTSPWSATAAVAGAYLDQFDDVNSGWDLPRMSYIEISELRYGQGHEAGNLILIVDDRYDWLLASPMRPAPSVPYVMEYRMRVHDQSNLVSGGAVFGGDWIEGACPDAGNIHETSNCFNHFYTLNTIWYAELKILFERVDYLFFCPDCGGSQLKRLSDNSSNWPLIDPIPNADPLGWNTWRVEVRANEIKLFVNDQLFFTSNDTKWVNDPYFGAFASTYEYKPSIWFYDYFKVTPLDN